MEVVSIEFVLTDVSKVNVEKKIVANETGGKKYIQRAEDEAFIIEAVRERGGWFENQTALRQSTLEKWTELLSMLKFVAENNLWYKENAALPDVLELKKNEYGMETQEETLRQYGIIEDNWNSSEMRASRIKRVDDFEKIYEDLSKMNYPMMSFGVDSQIIKIRGTFKQDARKWKNPGTSRKGGTYIERREGSSEWSDYLSLGQIRSEVNNPEISGQDSDGEEWNVQIGGEFLYTKVLLNETINKDKEDEQTIGKIETTYETEFEIDVSTLKLPIDPNIEIGDQLLGAYATLSGGSRQSEGSGYQQKNAMVKCRIEGKKVKIGVNEVNTFLQWAGWSRDAQSLTVRLEWTPLVIFSPLYRARIKKG